MNASDLVSRLFGWCGDDVDSVVLSVTLAEYPLRREVLMTSVVRLIGGTLSAGEASTSIESSRSDS